MLVCANIVKTSVVHMDNSCKLCLFCEVCNVVCCCINGFYPVKIKNLFVELTQLSVGRPDYNGRKGNALAIGHPQVPFPKKLSSSTGC